MADTRRISLEVPRPEDDTIGARDLLDQMSQGRYDRMSVLPLPDSTRDWRADHRTARKRADRAARRGYRAGALRRERHEQDIFEINTSAPARQGRPMDEGYRRPVHYSPLPAYPNPRHAIRTTGVFLEERCVAYLVMIRSGQLALVSQILGHWDHLEEEIMYLLFEYGLARETRGSTGDVVVYNRHDSGTRGLIFFKERLGFVEEAVTWHA